MRIDIFCRNREKAEQTFANYINDADMEKVHIIEGDLTKDISLTEEYDYIIHGGGNNHPAALQKNR